MPKDWDECTVRRVWVPDLRPTQDYVAPEFIKRYAGLWPDVDPIDVVWWRSNGYVHNGHHRWLVALAREVMWMPARIFLALD